MKKSIIPGVMIMIICISITKAIAQNPVIQWQKSIGGSSADQVQAIVQSADGSLGVAGYSLYFNGTASYNSLVAKLNANGGIIWSKSAITGTFGNYTAESIVANSDGGYTIAGNYYNQLDGKKGSEMWVAKLNNSGATVWSRIYGFDSSNEYAYSISHASNGGYEVAGSSDWHGQGLSTIIGSLPYHGGTDCIILPLDNDGYPIGYAGGPISLPDAGDTALSPGLFYGGTGTEVANSVIHTSDDGFVVAGYSNSNNGNLTVNHGDYDFWIFKTDYSGYLLWQKSYGGSRDDEATSVIQTKDGGYAVAGFTNSTDGNVTGIHTDPDDPGYIAYDFWLLKLDAVGNLQWKKCYGGSLEDRASSVTQTADGGYAITGYTRSHDGDVSNPLGDHNDPPPDAWVIKTDSTGARQWDMSLGNTNHSEINSIITTNQGNLVLAGFAEGDEGQVTESFGDYDVWVVNLKILTGLGLIPQNPVPGNITKFEYFFDKDPGFGNGKTISIPATTDLSNYTFAVDLTGLKKDTTHTLYVRTFDGWSQTNTRTFLIGTALPLTWISFNAKAVNRNVALDWRTASEINTDHFDIERSNDGVHFSKIGTVASSQNSAAESDYTFTDDNPINGISYYRLKQVDKDGHFTYSIIISVKMNTQLSVQIMGNPVHQNLHLQISATNGKPIPAWITDAAGRRYKTFTVAEGSKQINIEDLSSGVYYLMYQSGNSVVSIPFDKQ